MNQTDMARLIGCIAFLARALPKTKSAEREAVETQLEPLVEKYAAGIAGLTAIREEAPEVTPEEVAEYLAWKKAFEEREAELAQEVESADPTPTEED